jgi:hypothetical protein
MGLGLLLLLVGSGPGWTVHGLGGARVDCAGRDAARAGQGQDGRLERSVGGQGLAGQPARSVELGAVGAGHGQC